MKYFSLISILLFSTFFITSCADEDTATPADDRDQFIGYWDVNETCSRDSYSVQIVADPSNSSQVLIKNFWLIGNNEKPPYAIVAGSTITIPKQTMGNNDSNEVEGSGKLDKNKITWHYTVNDGADLYTCTAEYSK